MTFLKSIFEDFTHTLSAKKKSNLSRVKLSLGENHL